ncbi:MAG: HAMP domain-containing histidine kinase [Verrucomicrobiota bacterium]|nr:HAMP domain-containing histidine kinase [Verrucomicrobiota bacterium]
MKKTLWIFLLAVLLPSVVLGWLALRSAAEQGIILERRTAELYQKETESLAAAARAVVDDHRRSFADSLRSLLAQQPAEQLAPQFTTRLPGVWPQKAVGFVLSPEGRLVSPLARGKSTEPNLSRFILENSGFLTGRLTATVFPVPLEELNRPELMRKGKSAYFTEQGQDPASSQRAAPQSAGSVLTKESLALKSAPESAATPKADREGGAAPASRAAEPQSQSAQQGELEKNVSEIRQRAENPVRNVAPQQNTLLSERLAVSNLWSETTEFRALAADRPEGMVTRFVQDRLDLIFWLRPAQAPEWIFGCLVEATDLRDLWDAALPTAIGDSPQGPGSRNGGPDFVLALLDEKARPVVTLPRGATGREWKRPFVASEIGEALPHWEAALYLQRPQQLQESARSLRRTLSFVIAGLLGAIACGGWLVVQDARRQLALAQKKTDFVSNVSHELKTPLTSIRMFAELMQDGRPETMAKLPQYLRIIMVEAERLTRLINNVLDFAKFERKQKRFDKKPLDLHTVIARTWEAHELHLREAGFTTRWDSAEPPFPVIGDEDALAQILVNLLSNAEKYSGPRKEVALQSYREGNVAYVSVLDRGLGVPNGEERKIFEAFYRAHDSLSCGIQGSGLGLTLAQRLAREHGGEILYHAREGGGSRFTLRLPLSESHPSHDQVLDVDPSLRERRSEQDYEG